MPWVPKWPVTEQCCQKAGPGYSKPIFFRYRALTCAYASRERGASLSLKQKVVLDFYKGFKNRLLTLLPYLFE